MEQSVTVQLLQLYSNFDLEEIYAQYDHSSTSSTEYGSDITIHLEGGSLHTPSVMGPT